jgi:hypothetical protein
MSPFILVAIVFLVVIFLSLGCSCYNVSPYSKDDLFLHQYQYNNMEGYTGNTMLMPMSMPNIIDGNTMSMPMKQENFSSIGNSIIMPSMKIEGFEGLHSSPYTAEQTIDIYSQAIGNNRCVPGPYSNSQGYLCLDEKQKRLLMTRGGNFTGKDSQIGSQ